MVSSQLQVWCTDWDLAFAVIRPRPITAVCLLRQKNTCCQYIKCWKLEHPSRFKFQNGSIIYNRMIYIAACAPYINSTHILSDMSSMESYGKRTFDRLTALCGSHISPLSAHWWFAKLPRTHGGCRKKTCSENKIIELYSNNLAGC